MRIFPLLLFSLLSFHNRTPSAPLQREDIFAVASFKSPSLIAGYDRRAYIAGSEGILVYNHIEKKWEASIPFDGPILEMFYSVRNQRLRIRTHGGVLEYNETFRDWTSTDSLRYTFGEPELEPPAFKIADNLTGMIMPESWHFMPGRIRDGYMRSARIQAAVVFDYDQLWVLTDGLGIFKGSQRRRRLEPIWVGLDDPDVRTLYLKDKKIWMGGNGFRSALIETEPGLQQWRYFVPGYTGFTSGKVNDMRHWKNHLWIATDDGVARMDPESKTFYRYGYFQGLRTEEARVLGNHGGVLYAGTDRGLVSLEFLGGEFKPHPHPDILNLPVTGLAGSPEGLWVASKYGLFLYQNGDWSQPRKTHLTKGLKVADVRVKDSHLLWALENTAQRQTGEDQAEDLFKRAGLSELEVYGDLLMATYETGVLFYNLKNHLNIDFNLSDGIMGYRVNDAVYDGKYLWMATDAGVTRVEALKYIP